MKAAMEEARQLAAAAAFLAELRTAEVPAGTLAESLRRERADRRLVNWQWFRLKRRAVGSCVSSGALHGLLLYLLLTLHISLGPEWSWTSSAADTPQPVEIVVPPVFPEVDTPPAEVVPQEAAVSSQLAETETQDGSDEETSQAPGDEPTRAFTNDTAAVQVAEAMAPAEIEPQPPARPRPNASFFGIESPGERFVFCIDSSWSMRGTRWQQATQELLRSVEALPADASFYVIFFDAKAHPMFGAAQTPPEPVPATAENRHRLRKWIDTVQLGYETNPLPAVELAMSLQPDAVFLLSDGEFTPQTLAYLRACQAATTDNSDAARVPVVNAVALQNRAGEKLLQQLAQENGGQFRFVPAIRPTAQQFLDAKRAEQALGALGARFERDVFGNIRLVELRGADRGFEHLSGLPFLQELILAETGIGDESLERLSELPQLSVLVLSQTPITDKGLRHLSKASALQGLFLDGTQVTDEGMRALSDLADLRVLSTSGQLTDAGLDAMAALSNLEVLYLVEPRVTDRGLAHLRAARNLKALFLSNTSITDDGLEHLKGLTELQVLNLAGTRVTGRGLGPLRNLAQLRELDMSHTALNDEGAAVLSHLPHLVALRLDGTQISDGGLEHITRLSNLRAVTLTGTNVSEHARTQFAEELARRGETRTPQTR